MSFSIELTEHFKKEAKKLNKKYCSLKTELEAMGEELADKHVYFYVYILPES